MAAPINSAIRPPKVAELIADVIRADIYSGRLKDGDRLPHEQALMTGFDVSRPTLREALRTLERDELIEVRRGARGGATVRTPSTKPLARMVLDQLLLVPGQPCSAEVIEVLEDDQDLEWLIRAVRNAAVRQADRRRAKAVA